MLNVRYWFVVLYVMVGELIIRLSCRIFFCIDEWRSSFDHSKGSCYKFIFNNVYYQHFRFSFRLFPMVIIPQFRVKANGTDRSQIKHPFHLLISDGVYFSASPYAGSWLVVERRNSRIASKFSPIVKLCKIIGINNQICCAKVLIPGKLDCSPYIAFIKLIISSLQIMVMRF